jgi:cation/acetate symporter
MLGAALNFVVAFAISRSTAEVPEHVLDLVENIRIPKGVEKPHEH